VLIGLKGRSVLGYILDLLFNFIQSKQHKTNQNPFHRSAQKKKFFLFFLGFLIFSFGLGFGVWLFFFFLVWLTYRTYRITYLRGVGGAAAAIALVVALIVRPRVRLALWAAAAEAVHQITELRHVGRELCRGVDDGLVAEDDLTALVVNRGKMDLFPVRRELVVGVDEAEEVQDHARMTHIQAQSKIRAVDADVPALGLRRRFTARRCRFHWLCGRVGGRGDRGLGRLACKNRLGHLLCEIARRGDVTLLVIRGREERRRRFLRCRGADVHGNAHRSPRDADGRQRLHSIVVRARAAALRGTRVCAVAVQGRRA